MLVILTLLDPQYQTPVQEWRFEDATLIRIGRAVDNHVVLHSNLVSRYHLELKKLPENGDVDSWEVVSRGTNGTFVNGVLTSKCRLMDNYLLQLAQGGPIVRFQIQNIPNLTNPSWMEPQVTSQVSSLACKHEGNLPNNMFCVHCGQPISVIKKIRHYQVLRVLGQGGMGTTYLAWDGAGVNTAVPQLLVLKQTNRDMSGVAKAQELFEREANTLKCLHHSGIPKYYDFFVEGGKKFLAMELIQGQDLEKIVSYGGPVRVTQAIAWMVQTCEILDYLHSQDPPLIHRDIKPANLMVRNGNDRIVVLDFGAVKEIGSGSGTRIGAEGYCAPEQERGQPLTQSDLYAVGPTLIFLLTGQNPLNFFRPRGKEFCFDVQNIPTITPKIQKVIERVTQPLPGKRFQSAQDLAQALLEC
jgi:serine/threonine-protein kinase